MNLKLLTKTKSALICLLFCLLLSCQKEQDKQAIQPDVQQITVEEARTWFEQHVSSPDKVSTPNARKKQEKDPKWDYATKHTFKGKEVVAVPYVPKKGNTKGFHQKMLVSKDKKGNMKAQVLKITGTRNYLEETNYKLITDSFSGMVTVEDYEGNFIEGEWYVNGKFAGTLTEGNVSKAGRVQGHYITVVTFWFQQICMDGTCGGYTILSSTTKTIWVSDGTNLQSYLGTFYYYNTGGGGGGGTGGGNDCPYGPNCNQPVPYDEQVINEMEVIELATLAEAFDPSKIYNGNGIKPRQEYPNKCQGVQAMWNNFPNNEVHGYITKDGKLLVTDVISLTGGSVSGTYTHNGVTYYTWPASQGAPSHTYQDMQLVNGIYFIPVIASVHTHTPCRNDGTNGVSHNVGTDDSAFANSHATINHWIIGCGAIAQYNGTNSKFFNVQSGGLSTLCNNIR